MAVAAQRGGISLEAVPQQKTSRRPPSGFPKRAVAHAAQPMVMIAAATGGHVAAAERFAVTGARVG